MAIMYCRALENHDLGKATKLSTAFADLGAQGKNNHRSLYAMQGNEINIHLLAIKDFIVELARQDIDDNVKQLVCCADPNDEWKPRMKEHILNKLKRLSRSKVSYAIKSALPKRGKKMKKVARQPEITWESPASDDDILDTDAITKKGIKVKNGQHVLRLKISEFTHN